MTWTSDNWYVDSDADQLDDNWEIAQFGTLARDGTGDFDGDGLSDRAEHDYGLLAYNPDTDGDGTPDGYEVIQGTDPRDPASPVVALGDINADGSVNAGDLLLLQRIIFGTD